MRLIRLLKNDLARETEQWAEAGLISQSQAEAICARYGVDFHRIKNHSFGYRMLVGLGFVFIGLALITFISANWDQIPRAVRMWSLIALTMLVQGYAIRKYLNGDFNTSVAVFLLGNLFFGASIILIAQIYHLGEHMPDGIFWWALGCLPLALLLNSTWLALQTMVLALVWFFLEVSMDFYPQLFPLFIGSAALILYRGLPSALLFLVVIFSFGLWVEFSLSTYWREGRLYEIYAEHLAVAVSLFILFYAFSHWLKRRQSVKARDYAAVLSLWSLRFALVLLLILSFAEPWRELISADWAHQTSMLIIVCSLSAIAIGLSVGAGKLPLFAVIVLFYIASLAAVLATDDPAYSQYFQVIDNLVLITVAAGLIVYGIKEGISHYFFLGVVAVLLTAFLRYLDLVGDYFGAAALFLVFAVILLGAAWYWKRYQFRERPQ